MLYYLLSFYLGGALVYGCIFYTNVLTTTDKETLEIKNEVLEFTVNAPLHTKILMGLFFSLSIVIQALAWIYFVPYDLFSIGKKDQL